VHSSFSDSSDPLQRIGFVSMVVIALSQSIACPQTRYTERGSAAKKPEDIFVLVTSNKP